MALTLLLQLDLLLSVERTELSLFLSIKYRHLKYSRKSAAGFARTLEKIIAEIIAHPDSEIGQLDCTSEEDKLTVIGWNRGTPYAQMNCMHYLIEAVTRVIPHSEAICSWDGSLNYAELDALSSTAAQRLIRAGVGCGVYVPFAYEKSLWTVVATLAILKAGGAFVPLEPTHPRARLEEILKNVQAKIVVTSELYSPLFECLVEQVIVISERTTISEHAMSYDDFQYPDVRPHDPAFVLFTSGSTGHPKGMVHEHGAFCTHTITHGEAMGYHGARVLQFAAHTFDVAIIDIFTTLTFGGCICIPSEEDRRSNISGVIRSMKVDYTIWTPSFANLIDPTDVPTLKTLAIGGEALPQDCIEKWASKVQLIQIYGPAEAGIVLMIHMHPTKTRPETVGYPLRNSSCWLVDPANPHALVPIGAVGELVVAGPSLAQGYLNNEEKTQSAFLENLTWAKDLGLRYQRFYRTGDLLKYNIEAYDGSYDFIGRFDNQIKLRGQRMELGEVEHHIASISEVAVSMVTRPTQGCFAGELTAVVQMRNSQSSRVLNEPLAIASEQSLSVDMLRQHVAKVVPGYMLPTTCIVINNMPFVPSLKINRRLVESWLANMKSRPTQVVSAMTGDLSLSCLDPSEITANALSIEYAKLVALEDPTWRLRLEGHDFALQKAGIDSIRIISLSLFLQKFYGMKVPMQTLLSPKTTIRDLAFLIDHRNSSSIISNSYVNFDVLEESRFLSEKLEENIRSITAHASYDNFPICNIFLTGASGYLGSAILQQLMIHQRMSVFALVRCHNESDGLQRIIDAAVKAGWWQDSYASRIRVWKGDLTENRLGLEEEKLRRICGTKSGHADNIHAIIHNGAKVHYSSNYDTLKSVNVDPTLELLKVTACADQLSRFVYVSGGQKPNLNSGLASRAVQASKGNGYEQSKFISEKIVADAIQHPAFQRKHLYTVRPGYIIGSLKGGIANTSDFIWRLVAGCLEIKAYNAEEAAQWLFVADVEHVAQRVVASLFEQRPSGHTEQVLDGLLFSEFWAILKEDFGYKLEGIPHREWLIRMQNAIATKQEAHVLFPLLHTLEQGDEAGTVGSKQIPDVDCNWIKDVVKRNVRYLIDIGYLPASSKQSNGHI